MKKIDKLLLSSFFPPFVVTFFIALFVLIMQTLWVYIDDIIGKGAGIKMILEFMFYLSISVFPMALPVAVLISTVMVMGNLAEHYELSSMKSAGISLMRIMRPMMYACAGIAIFSWFSANYLIPVANLKFKSRLYDMRKQKPTLNMEEGIFNDDFAGYRIRIGEKGADKKIIKDVFIANHIGGQKDRLNELVAKEGVMYTTEDERYLVMELEKGEQFQEGDRYVASKNKAPFVRTSFSKYTKIFDMQEFDINQTDEELFRTHYSMLNMQQLQLAIDSIDQQIIDRKNTVGQYILNYVSALKKDTVKILSDDTLSDSLNALKKGMISIDSIKHKDSIANNKTAGKKNLSTHTNQNTKKAPKDIPDAISKTPVKSLKKKLSRTKYDPNTKITKQTINKPLNQYESLLQTFTTSRTVALADKAVQSSRSIKSNAESASRFIIKTKEKRVKHIFELHSKYAFATICFVFLFIGAPMGAIVRKGGFGYPLLIAIGFFVLFITLTLTFKRMAEAFAIPVLLAVWLPNLIIAPIGIYLTIKAMNDSRVFNFSKIKALYYFLSEKVKPKKVEI